MNGLVVAREQRPARLRTNRAPQAFRRSGVSVNGSEVIEIRKTSSLNGFQKHIEVWKKPLLASGRQTDNW